MSRIDEGGTQMAKLRWLTASQAIKCKCPAYNGLSNSAASTNTFATDTVTVIRSDAASQFPCASLPVTQRLSEWPIGGGGWQIPMLNAHLLSVFWSVSVQCMSGVMTDLLPLIINFLCSKFFVHFQGGRRTAYNTVGDLGEGQRCHILDAVCHFIQ